jgi:hypothetical protein
MKMTYTKSEYEMPDGKYLAKFVGVTMREDKPGDKPRLDRDGKPLPPAMTWDFEIVEGPEAGKKCDKLTGRVPTPKSGCGKMLVGITDTVLRDGQEVDLAGFVGQLYRVTVQDNRVSDNPPPARVYGSQPVPAAAAGGPPKPPPRPGQPAPPPKPASYWVTTEANDGDPKLMTEPEVRALAANTDVSSHIACPEAGGDWKPLSEVFPDLAGAIPF